MEHHTDQARRTIRRALTWLFLGVVGLGTAFVWMLWEIEQMSKPHRNSDRFG